MKNNSEPISLRITFLYEGSNVRMISRQKVKMTPFPSDPARDAKGQAGFWYELKDAWLNTSKVALNDEELIYSVPELTLNQNLRIIFIFMSTSLSYKKQSPLY